MGANINVRKFFCSKNWHQQGISIHDRHRFQSFFSPPLPCSGFVSHSLIKCCFLAMEGHGYGILRDSRLLKISLL